MSGATYRIEVRHEPVNETFVYSAYVYSLSDGRLAFVKSGISPEEALVRASDAIRAANNTDENRIYFSDDNGDAAPAPAPGYSVKV